MTDKTQGKLREALQFARTRKDQSLVQCLRRLKSRDIGNINTEIYIDWAPLSFYFVRTVNGNFSGNGGIIFHGKHDNGGDGGAPTFSVCLTPCNGWSIHT
jgi:hypothetical protein